MVAFFSPPPSYMAPTKFIDIVRQVGATANLEILVDAGDINSANGNTQVWFDVSGNANNLINGTNTSIQTYDHTFVGYPGGQSKNEYWERSATNVFRATNRPWIEAVAFNNAKVSVAVWAWGNSFPASFGCENYDSIGIVGGEAPNGGWGMGILVSNTTPYNIPAPVGSWGFQAYNNSLTAAYSAYTQTIVPTSGWHFTGFSLDEGAGTYTIQIDGTQSSNNSFSYGTPATLNTNRDLVMFRGGNGPSVGWRVNSMAWWSRGVGATTLMDIYNASKERFQ